MTLSPHLRTLRVAALPALTVLALLAGCRRAQTAVGGPPPVPVQVATVVQQDVPRRLESVGTVSALRTVAVKSQVDGVIAEIRFREGDDVKAGDPLVTLDRRPFANALQQARAALATAQAQAAQAAVDLERYSHLDQQSAISKEAYAQYVTRAQTTKADVEAKEAAVANAELQLSYAEIRAPITGRTGQRLLHEGALVKANDGAFSLVTINQLAPVAVTYSVPEGALEEIRRAFAAGTATVTAVDRVSGAKSGAGRLDFIDNTVDPTTGMITLKAVFPNDDLVFWPGRFVSVITVTGVDPGAYVIPTSAILNSQSGSTLYVLRPDRTVELRSVKVVRTDGENSILREGLKAGEVVVTDGQLRLLPGLKAEPRTLSGAPVADTPAVAVPAKS